MTSLLDLAFLSGNSIDKVFNSGDGTGTIPAGNSLTINIPHEIGKQCFFNVQWGYDGVKWFPAGHIDNQTYGPLAWVRCYAYTDATNLVIYFNKTGSGTRSIRYRYEMFFSELA